MEKEVVILDIDYVSYEDKPVIRLFSKDGDKNVVTGRCRNRKGNKKRLSN